MVEDPKKLYIREKLTCRAEIRGRVFNFELQVMDLDARGIVTDGPDLAGARLKVGQEVLIRYYRADSAYQFLAKVIEQDLEEETGVITLRFAFPKKITRYQRRKHSRLTLDGAVKFKRTNENRVFRGFVKDVSTGGIQFSTQRTEIFAVPSDAVGQHLVLDFTLSTGDDFTGMIGQVRRVSPDPERNEFVRVQVLFSKIKGRVKERLVAVEKKLSK